uniref:Uncharacterized protein n=1 Tax=Vespula pensylvanica TaxID=30213 RepID=A0A834U998_VESPE|nr:hypothetical protein H0235_008632 [Vespula pensylvanica]
MVVLPMLPVSVSVGVSVGIRVSHCGGSVRMAKRFKEGAREDNGPNTTTVAVAAVISSRIMGYAGEASSTVTVLYRIFL